MRRELRNPNQGGVTFHLLPQGLWGLKSSETLIQGDRVQVRKSSGERTVMLVGALIEYDSVSGKYVYEAINPTTGGHSISKMAKQDGRKFCKTHNCSNIAKDGGDLCESCEFDHYDY